MMVSEFEDVALDESGSGIALARQAENEEGFLGIRVKTLDPRPPMLEQRCHLLGAGTADHDPDHLRRSASQETELAEVIILGHQDKSILCRAIPQLKIGAASKPKVANMLAVGEHR